MVPPGLARLKMTRSRSGLTEVVQELGHQLNGMGTYTFYKQKVALVIYGSPDC
jgi:hypothetical protein